MSTREDIEAGLPVELFGHYYSWDRRSGRWRLVREPDELEGPRRDLVAALLSAWGQGSPGEPTAGVAGEGAATAGHPARWVPWWTARQLDWLRRLVLLPRLRSIARRGVRRGTGEL